MPSFRVSIAMGGSINIICLKYHYLKKWSDRFNKKLVSEIEKACEKACEFEVWSLLIAILNGPFNMDHNMLS